MKDWESNNARRWAGGAERSWGMRGLRGGRGVKGGDMIWTRERMVGRRESGYVVTR